MVEDVDWPGIVGVEADEQVDRREAEGEQVSTRCDGDAVDPPLPFELGNGVDVGCLGRVGSGWWRSRCWNVVKKDPLPAEGKHEVADDFEINALKFLGEEGGFNTRGTLLTYECLAYGKM